MVKYRTVFVGTPEEVAHHAQPYARELSVEITSPDQAAGACRPGDVAIFYSEHFERFRHAWRDLHEKGCHTLYAIDGILEWRNAWENRRDEPACPWTMRPVLSDKVACIGPSQARILDAWGNVGKTEIVGLPRLHDLTRENRKSPDEHFDLLVMTAKWPGFTDEQTEAVVRSLLDIKRYFAEHPMIDGRIVRVTWRLTKDLDQRVGVVNDLRELSGRDLCSTLRRVDAVVTTPSTAILEAMLVGLPACVLDYSNSPRYVDAAWSITAPEHIARCIEQLAQPSANRMLHQHGLLRDSLCAPQEAPQRMIQLVTEMQRIGHDCRASGQPVVFPNRILPAPHAAFDFELEQVYPRYFAAKEQSPEMAAHLAECRRTIDYLRDQVADLEEDLERAAAAFEQLHNHPIAGRVIRLRQKLIDLAGRLRTNRETAPGRGSDSRASSAEAP